MKKMICALLFTGAVLTLHGQTRNVEVQFTYTRQSGFASNQFAVWIEDAQGKHIKTLFATNFTAAGGWQRRETSIPLWVKQSGLAGMSKSQVDAITGSTPKSGSLRYAWDGKDSAGRPAPDGEYRVLVEATLRNEDRVLYTARIRLGGASGQTNAQAQYFGSGTAERGMIGPVTVRY